MSGKRKRLTLKEKVAIIDESESLDLSCRQAAKRFCIGKTLASDILANKKAIKEEYLKNGNDESKRKFPNVESLVIDDVVYRWFCRARANLVPISGPLIQAKALEVAKEVNLHDFAASNGWLDKFKSRHKICFKSVSGESAVVDKSVIDDWFGKIGKICENYSERDIMNLDESGLFFKALPDKTMSLKNENCSGGKLAKDRLTVMFCVNMLGEFEDPLIIGRWGRPRCFGRMDINSFGVVFKHNTRAWMTLEIMTSWLEALNLKMKRKKRKILLFLDNATCHPQDMEFSNIELVYFPPNTTSVSQPLDQGKAFGAINF